MYIKGGSRSAPTLLSWEKGEGDLNSSPPAYVQYRPQETLDIAIKCFFISLFVWLLLLLLVLRDHHCLRINSHITASINYLIGYVLFNSINEKNDWIPTNNVI